MIQKGPAEGLVNSINQTDEQKHESKARFKLGDLSRSHKERSHDRYSEDLKAELRNWSFPKTSLPSVRLDIFADDPLE